MASFKLCIHVGFFWVVVVLGGGVPGPALLGRPFVVSLRHESDLKVWHAVLSHLSDGLVLKKWRWVGFN